MDPFSAEGELVNLHNAFHQGQHTAVLNFDTKTLSPSNILPAKILQYRSKIALGQHDQVLQELESEDEEEIPDYEAVKVFAEYDRKKKLEGKEEGNENENENVKDEVEMATELADGRGDNLSVQVLCGIVLAREGREKDALELLGRHEGSLDAVALIVQIHLRQNRLDLAQQEVRKAKTWAQDNLLVNLAESWVGLREGGEKYQSSFYVYEELATAPPTSSAASNTQNLLCQSICELHLGRLPEAEAAMNTALEQAPQDPDVLTNAIVLNTVAGGGKERMDKIVELKDRLAKVDEANQLLSDLVEKNGLFDAAMGKYNPIFEVAR